MKKIMFNDNYGLTRAAIDGKKPMTRRIESGMENLEEGNFCFLKRKQEIEIYGEKGTIIETIMPRYKVGEVVAIAQSYKDAGYTKEWVEQNISPNPNAKPTDTFDKKYPGWSNKMFVKADLMPTRIRITDIRVERLQAISDEDCLREGIRLYSTGMPQCKEQVVGNLEYIPPYGFDDYHHKFFCNYDTPREAFAELIDNVSGRGTWKRNPWVFVYEFELEKGGER